MANTGAQQSATQAPRLGQRLSPGGGTVEQAIRHCEAARDFLAREPGYVSTRLHGAIRPGAKFQLINVADLTSAEAFDAATAKVRREPATPPPPGACASRLGSTGWRE